MVAMATTRSPYTSRPSYRVDFAGVALFVCGVLFGALSYWLITSRGSNPLILVPSIVAATSGASHLLKRQAPHG